MGHELPFDPPQFAAGDAGGALGAALAAYHMEFAQTRETSNALNDMAGAYLGPAYEADGIAARLGAIGARFETLDDEELYEGTVDALVSERPWAGFKGVWNSVRALSATVQSLPTRVAQACSGR